MEFKGTKGEWHVSGLDQTFVYALNESGTNSFSLNINNDGKTNIKEQQANALLISKAPEMLEMLQKCLCEFLDYSTTLSQVELATDIKQLIKQATEL